MTPREAAHIHWRATGHLLQLPKDTVIALDCVVHTLARSVQAAATTVQREKGDYASPLS